MFHGLFAKQKVLDYYSLKLFAKTKVLDLLLTTFDARNSQLGMFAAMAA